MGGRGVEKDGLQLQHHNSMPPELKLITPRAPARAQPSMRPPSTKPSQGTATCGALIAWQTLVLIGIARTGTFAIRFTYFDIYF